MKLHTGENITFNNILWGFIGGVFCHLEHIKKAVDIYFHMVIWLCMSVCMCVCARVFWGVQWDNGDYVDVILLIGITFKAIYFTHKVSSEAESND